MADQTLKAAIELTADASGMKSGIGSALSQLDSMRKGVAGVMNNPAIQMGIKAVEWMFDNAMERMNELRDNARQFSADGANGAAQVEAAKLKAQVDMGKAFGPSEAALSAQQAQAEKDRGAYMAANAGSFTGLAAMTQSIGQQGVDLKDQIAVGFADAVDYVFQLNGKPTSTTDQFVSGVSGVGGFNMVLDLYDLLRSKLGGN